MSHLFYEFLHVVSVMLLFAAFGMSVLFLMIDKFPASARKWIAISHGIALVLILISGFGMLAKLGYMASIPGWAWVKLGVWLALGAVMAGIRRRKLAPKVLLSCVITLGALAVYMALYKPF